ncbi:MAG: hypothetical protein PVH29_12655 [Candidatus Zixiibacteriota bacterium]
MTRHFPKFAAVLILTVACSSGGGSGPSEPVDTWRPVKSPTANDIHALWANAEDDVWACGKNGNILHYDGGEWRLDITELAPDFYDVQFVSPTVGWVCGKDGWVARLENGEWTRVAGIPRTNTLYAMHARNEEGAWFCGAGGTVLHYQSGEWVDESPGISEDLAGIRVFSLDKGWLVGDGGRIMERKNGTWSRVTSPVQADYECMFFVSEDEGWFGATDGFAVHLKGGGLSKTRLPNPETITSLFFNQEGRGYAVTKAGNIYFYAPATGEWRLWDGVSHQLYDITFPAGGHGWIVGAEGTILRN